MKTAFVIRAPQDRAVAAEFGEALEAAGLRMALRPVKGDRYEIEAVAARMKASDIAVLLLSSQSAGSVEFRRDLHIALLYERPLVVGALERDVDIEAFVEDREISVGTLYAARPDDLRARLLDQVHIGATPDASVEESQPPADGAAQGDAATGGLVEEDALEPFASRVAPLVERVRKEAAVAAGTTTTGEEDALGFPKSAGAMLARWRLIEPSATIEDLQAFHDDYREDPYFGPLAYDAMMGMRRQRFARGAGGVLRWTLGTAAAAAVFGYAVFICSDGGCWTPGGAPLSTAATARLTGYEAAETARVAALDEEADDLAQALALEQERARRLAAALEEAEAARERLQERLAATSASQIAGESNADAERRRADAAERRISSLEAQIAALEDEARLAQGSADDAAEAAIARLTRAVETQTADLEEAQAATIAAQTQADAAERRADAADAEIAAARAEAAAAETARRAAEDALEETRDALAARNRASNETLAEAEARARAAAEEAEQARGRVQAAESALAAAQRERDDANARLAAAEEITAAALARAEQAEAALRSAEDEIADLQTALAQEGDSRLSTGLAAAPASGNGAVRLLERLEVGLRAEDQRRREAGRRNVMRGPTLRAPQIEQLQRCLRNEIGEPRVVDGLWGARTTRAVLMLTAEQADAVADCMFE